VSRDDGFAIADVDTGLLDDAKVRALWRLLGEPTAMCHALTIREAVLLASWREGHRVTAETSAPVWLPLPTTLLDALVTVGLLDRSHRMPRRSWDSWFGPAYARREERREAGRRGGLAKAKRSSSSATATLYPSVPSSSIPSVPSRARPRERGGAALEPLADILGRNGIDPSLVSPSNKGVDKP
jgi:hypothetical protein